MAGERAYFYRAGALVRDPEHSAEALEGLTIETNWPGGYGSCSFVLARDPAAWWAVKLADEVIIRDGLKILYQGEIVPRGEIDERGRRVSIDATGYYNVLLRRRIRKRWLDNEVVSRLRVPTARKVTVSQMNMDANKNGNVFLVRGGYGDVSHDPGDDYHEEYVMPADNPIRKVTSSYACRSGEGIKGEIYAEDTATSEASFDDNSGTEQSGNLNTAEPLSGGDSEHITLRVTLTTALADTYDENDRFQIFNLKVYGQYNASHPDYAAPNYTNGEIVQDVLLEKAPEISVDYSQWDEPALALAAFTTAGDGFERCADVIARLLAFGDASQNTYALLIWDEAGTSDGLPRSVVQVRAVDDYEWYCTLSECTQFTDEASLNELWNNVIVRYENNEGLTLYLTGDDDATLTDAASVAAYGERHSDVIDIGKASTAEPQAIGQRVLAYHKDPLYKTGFTLTGTVRNKQGVEYPVAWVRAGQRIKIMDYRDGIIYFIRRTTYQADQQTLRITPDLPPDDMQVWMAQLRAGI